MPEWLLTVDVETMNQLCSGSGVAFAGFSQGEEGASYCREDRSRDHHHLPLPARLPSALRAPFLVLFDTGVVGIVWCKTARGFLYYANPGPLPRTLHALKL